MMWSIKMIFLTYQKFNILLHLDNFVLRRNLLRAINQLLQLKDLEKSLQEIASTSMHSSRMRTACLLTVSHSILGVSAWGRCVQRVCVRGDVCPGVCVCPGWGRQGWVCIPACNGADLPPLNRTTDRCKNITLPQTSFVGGKNGHPMRVLVRWNLVTKTAWCELLALNRWNVI